MQRKEKDIYTHYSLLSHSGKRFVPSIKKSGGGLIKDNDQSFSKNVCPPVFRRRAANKSKGICFNGAADLLAAALGTGQPCKIRNEGEIGVSRRETIPRALTNNEGTWMRGRDRSGDHCVPRHNTLQPGNSMRAIIICHPV